MKKRKDYLSTIIGIFIVIVTGIALISACDVPIRPHRSTDGDAIAKPVPEVKTRTSGTDYANPPGGLSAGDTPQFIVITIDDALNQTNYQNTDMILSKGYVNPNGAPLPITYFVSTRFTDYHLVQRRYAQGCEIGVHTMTHTTGVATSYEEWFAELIGARETISQLAGIPLDKIVGFRAPNLAYADNSFSILHSEGMLYDASVTEQLGKNSVDGASFIYPYDLADITVQNFSVSEGPKKPYPGLWEIPMWAIHNENGVLIGNMDPIGGYADLLAMFKRLFTERYNGNRAPMGIFLHPAWFGETGHADALNDFIVWAQTHAGVWFVTNQQLIAWMKNPTPISGMNTFAPVQWTAPAAGDEVADGWDNNGNGEIDEGFVHRCDYNEGWFNTTADLCPAQYPMPVIGDVPTPTQTPPGQTPTPTAVGQYPAWNPTTTYNNKDYVTHNGSVWMAQWYTVNEEPGTTGEWGVWLYIGPAGDVPTPTPTVVPPTATPTPTIEPTPTPTVEQTPTPTVEQTPTPTVNQTPTPTVEQSPTPTPTVNPVTPTPSPTAMSSGCQGVEPWDPAEIWNNYNENDLRTYQGALYSCINVAYAIYPPTSSTGQFGWEFVRNCN